MVHDVTMISVCRLTGLRRGFVNDEIIKNTVLTVAIIIIIFFILNGGVCEKNFFNLSF